MRPEYDFSKGERGKFFHADARHPMMIVRRRGTHGTAGGLFRGVSRNPAASGSGWTAISGPG